MKVKIGNNLNELEKAGVVSHRDNYQALINSVVQVRHVVFRTPRELPPLTTL